MGKLNQAAQDAIETERKKSFPPPSHTNASPLPEPVIEASKLIEDAYTKLYKRVQDEPLTESKNEAWKKSKIELLDKVSIFFRPMNM